MRGSFLPCGKAVRLPFVGVFLVAAVGCAVGEWWQTSPMWSALVAGLLLLPTVCRGFSATFWPGVFFFFVTLQAGQQQWAGGKRLLENFPNTPIVIEIRGIVADPAQPSGNAWRFPLEILDTKLPGGEELPVNGLVSVRWPGVSPNYGDIVAIRGSLRPVQQPRNPGAFDFARWLRLRGIWAELRASSESDVRILGTGRGNPIKELAGKTREKIAELLGTGIEQFPEVRGLLLAMTLGSTDDIPPPLLEQFRVTGTLHLFSVSGLHVGMLGVLLWIGLKPLRLPFPVLVLTIIFLLFFYAGVTGLRPASVRAAFMAAVVLGGLLLSRPAAPLNSLAAAGFFLLLSDSAQIFNPGFQLSFSVVTAILLVGVPFSKWMRDHTGPDHFLPVQLYGAAEKIHSWVSREAGALAAVSASAWLGSLPLIAANYNLVSLSALPVNILAVPLAFVILAVAILSLVSGAVFPLCAAIFNHTNVLVCSLLLGLIQFAASVPGSSFRFANPLQQRFPSSAVFFDFRSGESTAIRSGDGVWLVDTGSKWDWEQTIAPWLATCGFSRIDGLFLTHSDTRHIGGAEAAIGSFHPGFVAVSALAERSSTMRRLYEIMATNGLPRRLVFAGIQWQVASGWQVEVLFPPMGLRAGRADERTLVTRWANGGVRILLMGDADISVQQWLLQNAQGKLQADILRLGRPATGEVPLQQFLRAVSARAIVVSAAEFPAHEQYTALWAQSLETTGATIFRQDQTGAVLFNKNETRAELHSFLPGGPSILWSTE